VKGRKDARKGEKKVELVKKLIGAAIFSLFSSFHPFTLSPIYLFITHCANYAKMWLKEAIHDTEKDELAAA